MLHGSGGMFFGFRRSVAASVSGDIVVLPKLGEHQM